MTTNVKWTNKRLKSAFVTSENGEADVRVEHNLGTCGNKSVVLIRFYNGKKVYKHITSNMIDSGNANMMLPHHMESWIISSMHEFEEYKMAWDNVPSSASPTDDDAY